MKKYAAFVSLAVMILYSQSARASTHHFSGTKTILVLGDSLSDGFGLKRSEAYPALLTEKLRAAGMVNFEVMNASQSGGTTDGGLQRLPPHLKRKIDIFILELGINDAFLGVPIGEIRDNLQAIMDRVRGSNPDVRIVITGMQVPDSTANDYVSAFENIYGELATKNHAALVPALLAGVMGDPLMTLPDRIHPNSAGQKILAENVWRVLEPVARDATTEAPAHDR